MIGALPAVEVRGVSRRFGATVALSAVSLTVRRGEIHALLGPNGAGKTTLLRILSGLAEPSEGAVRVLGYDARAWRREMRHLVGLIPSGDRSFYLRLSGFENLLFFARLHGMSRREAASRAGDLLARVGLAGAEGVPVGRYSHGMQKRLAVARALVADPPLLLVDEATHDLDPEGARRVQDLIREAAAGGAAVIWTTQRVDEIRGLADAVTLLHRGRVRFAGSVAQLMAHSPARRYMVRIQNGGASGDAVGTTLAGALDGMGAIEADRGGDGEHHVLVLAGETALGDALASLARAGFRVLACREERPELEEAFLRLTGEGSP